MADICITGLCKAYDGKPVLRDFSAVLPAGRVTGLMAPSGAGKTTLLRILMGLEQPDAGSVAGLEGRRMSAVFQEDRLTLWPTSDWSHPGLPAQRRWTRWMP